MLDAADQFRVLLIDPPIDAPVFDVDGITKLSGSNYLAQLYGGPTIASLRPVGNPSPFRTGSATGYFYPKQVVLPTVPSDSTAVVQVRAWDVTAGASYEEARGMGGKFGKSSLLTLQVGGGLSLPANLIGLESFQLQAGLPEFATGLIQFVEQDPVGTLVWSHQGELGYRYLIERSFGGFEWQPFVVVTNTSVTVPFTDTADPSAPMMFYRSRILD